METRLRIGLLGAFSIEAVPPTSASISSRQQSIIACVLLNRAAPLARSHVAGLLWPESTDAQALTNLRRELHHLRRILPGLDRHFDFESRMLAIRSMRALACDVFEFEAAAAEGLAGQRQSLADAVRLYGGDLLPGCDDEWIQPAREALRRRAIETLGRLVDVLERERALGDAIEQAQRLIGMDPMCEPAWRALMRCHAGRGQRANALHAYQTCASVLEREVGAQPSAATRRAYRELIEHDETTIETMPASTAQSASVYPLVGRSAEWETLQAAWRHAATGSSSFVLIRGEAGIGKTRLTQELIDWCAAHDVRVAATRCYAGEGRLAYGPVAEWLGSDALRPALSMVDVVWLAEAARLRPEILAGRAGVPTPEPHLESWHRRRFFEALARLICAAAPIVLIVDDLQWCDSDTLEWLHFLAHFDTGARCLVVGTVRAEDEGDNAALGVLLRELPREDRLSVIDLGVLDEESAARLAGIAGDRVFDASALASLVRSSGGHPLFIVESARMGVSHGGGYAAVPPRVQAVVAARLAELSAPALALAELAAVIGRDFTVGLIAAATDLDDAALVAALDELWRRRVVREMERGGWDFTHDRIREVTYAQIGPARRRLLHRRAAQALELVHAADLDAVSGAIASHLDIAQQHARAVEFFERAARVGTRVCASEEAIRCLTRALEVLANLPASRDRDRVELRLQRALCTPITSARGYTAREAEVVLERAIALATALGDTDAEIRTLWGLGTVFFVRGNVAPAHAIGERASELSTRSSSRPCDAHHLLGGTLISRGDLAGARREFETLIAAYDPANPAVSTFGSDFGVFGHAWLAHVLCLMGETDTGLRHATDALEFAERTNHPYNIALAHAYAAMAHQFLRRSAEVRASAETAIALCERHGFAYYGEWALTLLGWARLQEGRVDDALHLMRSGIDGLRQQGALIRQPYYLSLLAEAYLAAGARDAAAGVLDAALAAAEERDDRWWSPELHRLRGLTTDGRDSERHFQTALSIARAQGNRLLERRAEESLRTIERTLPERHGR